VAARLGVSSGDLDLFPLPAEEGRDGGERHRTDATRSTDPSSSSWRADAATDPLWRELLPCAPTLPPGAPPPAAVALLRWRGLDAAGRSGRSSEAVKLELGRRVRPWPWPERGRGGGGVFFAGSGDSVPTRPPAVALEQGRGARLLDSSAGEEMKPTPLRPPTSSTSQIREVARTGARPRP
jgi:hypothetical protein